MWVKFFDVPLECWSMLGLSELASSLGKPIHADSMTEDRKRLGLACICIEMSDSSSFPWFIKLYQGIDEFSGEPKIARILVEYQCLPSVCKQCQVFGHKDSSCPHRAPSTSPQLRKVLPLALCRPRRLGSLSPKLLPPI